MIPKEYDNQSTNIASYDFTDLAEGTGSVLYGGLKTSNNSGTTTLLSAQNSYSAAIESSGSYTSVGASSYQIINVLDLDFDLSSFAFPKEVKGTAFVEVFYLCKDTSSSGPGTDAFITARLRKWDGTTETNIYSVSGSKAAVATGTTFSGSSVLQIPIPLTQYKQGEILRMTIEGNIARNQDGNDCSGSFIIAHDPMSRSGTFIKITNAGTPSTKLNFSCPYQIDV